MQIKTKAIVIKAQDYNENDRLLSLLTEDRGVVFAYAPGARKLKSKLSTMSSMLCYGEFVLFKNHDKYTIDSAESECLFFGIRKDLDKLSYASYFCELCQTVITSEEPSADILKLFLNTLFFLENGKVSAPVLKSILELRVMSTIGYTPDFVACSECYEYEKEYYWFDVQAGKNVCIDCKPKPGENDMGLSKAAFLAARHIVYAPIEQLFSFRIGEKATVELSLATEKYVLVQTDRTYQTLEFLNSIRSF